MNQKSCSPFLFACGVPRSGTTLLQRMLDSHPEIAVANDSHFVPRALELTDTSLMETAYLGLPIPLTTDLASQVYGYHRFRRMETSQNEFDDVCDASETYQQLVAGLYDLYARKRNKRLGGEKTPDYVRRLGLLHALFPAAKLIHLVRDGRDVALSLMGWATSGKGPGRIPLWNENRIAVCALWWSWMVTEARRQAAQIDPTAYLEVRYEELVSQPATTLGTICEFLEIDASEQMANYHLGKSRARGGLSAKSAWLAPQQGLRDWRRDMASEQVQLFETLASDALREFGYQRQTQIVSNRILATAWECQSWWNEHFLPKHTGQDSRIDATSGTSPTAPSMSSRARA